MSAEKQTRRDRARERDELERLAQFARGELSGRLHMAGDRDGAVEVAFTPIVPAPEGPQ
jgi:hypothetical protein